MENTASRNPTPNLLPGFILENYAVGKTSGAFPAAGMFVDMVGFSTMTDTLMVHGQHGAEVLAEVMGSVLDALIKSVYSQGGFVATMAGDAFTALFPVGEYEGEVCYRSIAAACEIQEFLKANAEYPTLYQAFTITAKVGLTFGEVVWGIVSSRDERRAAYYFQGSAIDGSAEAEHHAQAGEVILDASILGRVTDAVSVGTTNDHFRLQGVNTTLPKPQPVVQPRIDPDYAARFYPELLAAQPNNGEFRQVVNLFVNLPTVRTDAQLRIFMASLFSLMDKYGGLLSGLDFGDKGSNLLLFWGTPIAYENDIDRALNFVLDLQVMTSIPINAGLTYTIAHAGYVGSSLRKEYTCYGRGVNLAARFMSAARPGEIWVDGKIARRIGNDYEIDYEGELSFKGFARPQQVYVLYERKQESKSFYRGSLVGRAEELEKLEQFTSPLWNGQYAGTLVVRGEPGIGKSRLVHEYQESQLRAGREVLWAPCQTDEIMRKSLNPFSYWLRRYFGVSDTQGEARNKRSFNRKLQSLLDATDGTNQANELDRTRSCLGALIDLYWPDSLYSQLDAEGRYENTFIALQNLLLAESARQPVVLFIEDLQWLDQDSYAFLSGFQEKLMIDGGQSYPTAILATSRLEDSTAPHHDTLVNQEITLGGLSREALASLATAQLGGPVSPGLIDLLEQQAENNPFFAEQLLLYLRNQPLLIRGQNGWELGEVGDRFPIPADVRSLLVARLDQLTQAVKDTVQTASVLGREFDLRLLAYMLGSEEMLPLVSRAEAQGIWSRVDENHYMFNHALLREAAYSMQVRSRRQALHAHAVDGLESLFQDDLNAHYSELAYHSERANLVDKALEYLTLAGEKAAKRYANAEAIDHFKRALALLSSIEKMSERDQRELALQLLLGPLLITTLGYAAPEVERTFARAHELASRTRQTKLLFNAIWGQWVHYNMIYDLEKAQKLLDQLFVLGEGSGDSSLLLEAHHSGWATELHRGNAPAVEKHVKRGLDIYDATMHADHIKLYGHDPGACALGCRGLNHWLLGYPDQARKWAFKGLALAEGHEHPFSIAELKWFVVVVLSLRGESQEALNRLEELILYSQEYEYPLINKLSTYLYDVLKIHLEQDMDGAIQLREAFNQVLAMKGFMLRAWFLSLYLDICILTGVVESGLVAIEREMADHPISGERLFEAEVRRLWGKLLLVKEDVEVREAETQFKIAIDISRRQGARSLELRATMSLAQLWQRQGKRREAHQRLNTIFDWFTEGLDTADLRAARRLVTELE